MMLSLGDPTKLRDIAFVARPAWDRAVTALRVPDGSSSGSGPPTLRELTPVKNARLEVFRRVVLLRLGIRPDMPGDASIPTARVGAPPLPPAGGGLTAGGASPTPASPTRKLKLSAVIDPTLDAEVQQVSPAEITEMYTRYKNRFGDHPSPDVEPTPDQISALRQLIQAGAARYADFSVCGPHALRTLRKSVFTSYILNSATGEWSKKEMPGPANITSWEKSFKTFKVAMLLLEAAESERLEAYLEFVKDLNQQFGDAAWGTLYRAEARMRSEFFDRIRRNLHEQPKHGFTGASPWSAAFAQAIREAEYWAREFTTPATLLLAKHRQLLDRDSSPLRETVRARPNQGRGRHPGRESQAPRSTGAKT